MRIKLKRMEVKLLFVLGLNCHNSRGVGLGGLAFEFGGGKGSEALDFMGSRERGCRSLGRQRALSLSLPKCIQKTGEVVGPWREFAWLRIEEGRLPAGESREMVGSGENSPWLGRSRSSLKWR